MGQSVSPPPARPGPKPGRNPAAWQRRVAARGRRCAGVEIDADPGTGAADEQGVGNVFNVPLESGSGSAEFRREMERVVLPALEEFDPALILISAGFDAHARDPLASLRLEEEDFAWITGKLVEIAGEHCDGRIVSTLEGGYDLEALANSVTAHVGELMRA